RGPKGPVALPCMCSGHLGALVILVRYRGHEIFQRFILDGLPGPGDRKDKAPAAYGIGMVPVLDHPDVVLGTVGSIATHDHQFGPPWGNKRHDHGAKQGVFAAIVGVALGQAESSPARDSRPTPPATARSADRKTRADAGRYAPSAPQ